MDIEKEKVILEAIDKEKFRRRLLVYSRWIAVGLVLAILWFGYVNYSYANDVREIMKNNGSLGYCYLCGMETLKKCDCQYNFNMYGNKPDMKQVAQDTAWYNSQMCEGYKDLSPQTSLDFNRTV